MRGFAFAIPGDLSLATGGYAYDRRVMRECRAIGRTVTYLPLPGDFPNPSQASLAAAEAAFAGLPPDLPVLVDGLAYGALPAALLKRSGRRFIALVHHPLALETGLSVAAVARLRETERAALAEAAGVIATSPATARCLTADYGVAPTRLSVAPPGTDPAPRATGSGGTPAILTVGALVPRKGYTVLVQALARLRALAWTCRIVGATDRDPAEAARIAAAIADCGLADRIAVTGRLPAEALERSFAQSDIFVLPSFHEGYGMVLSEALARGLPIVATRAGAIPDTVPADTGLLVEPGDVAGLAAALERLLSDAAFRRAMAEAAWRAGSRLPGWAETAMRIIQAVAALPHASMSQS